MTLSKRQKNMGTWFSFILLAIVVASIVFFTLQDWYLKTFGISWQVKYICGDNVTSIYSGKLYWRKEEAFTDAKQAYDTAASGKNCRLLNITLQ